MHNEYLWLQFKTDPSPELKQEIISTYLNLVHYVIHHSKLYNADIFDDRDFFQFGIEGLSEAIDRFDPDFGTKFETYAIQRIKGKIIDELRKAQRRPRVMASDGTKVPAQKNLSLDITSENVEGTHSLHDILPDDADSPLDLAEKNEIKNQLVKEIQKLDERSRLVITLYYYEELNYKEIAKVLDITVSRVSQIHSKIMKSLKNKLLLYHE
jgi:RNA polymerase sigma factor for flagellar operon FliA